MIGLRVEGDGLGAAPRSGVARPALGVAAPSPGVNRAACGQELDVAAGVTVGRRDEADAAVDDHVVIPHDLERYDSK